MRATTNGSAGAPEGFWLRADVQSAGRGRLRRAWVSPAGNLHASTIVRPVRGDPPAQTLALVAAVALHEALSGEADGLTIKWPNDILAPGGAKLGGILLERADDAVVVGIGANLAHHPVLDERPATSLAALGTPVLAPAMAVEVVVDAFARALARWRSAGLAATIREWSLRAHPVGTALRIVLPDGETATGLFDGLDDEGALRLRLAGGGTRVIHAADVALIPD